MVTSDINALLVLTKWNKNMEFEKHWTSMYINYKFMLCIFWKYYMCLSIRSRNMIRPAHSHLRSASYYTFINNCNIIKSSTIYTRVQIDEFHDFAFTIQRRRVCNSQIHMTTHQLHDTSRTYVFLIRNVHAKFTPLELKKIIFT